MVDNEIVGAGHKSPIITISQTIVFNICKDNNTVFVTNQSRNEKSLYSSFNGNKYHVIRLKTYKLKIVITDYGAGLLISY